MTRPELTAPLGEWLLAPEMFTPSELAAWRQAHATRATRGAFLVDAYCAEYGGDGECAVRDILADLMHFCDFGSWRWPEELHSAEAHYHAEAVQPDQEAIDAAVSLPGSRAGRE